MKRILIVDDAITMRQLVAATLKSAGYEVVDARDGVDALKKLETGRFNLIVSDVNMPNMDGMELIKTLKSDPKYKFIPIVVLTKEDSPEMKRKGQAAGAKAWVVKPFKPNTILEVIKKIM